MIIVTMADDDQISSLAIRIEGCVVVAWERAMFKMVSQVCVSSMTLGSTWSVTAGVADDDYWYRWMDLDVDQRMLAVCVVLGYEEC